MREQSISAATTMRAIVYRRFGSPEVLSLVEVPRPEPGDTEVLIKVEATTVGPPDCAARAADPVYARLVYGLGKPRYPVLGGAAAGENDAVGNGVTGFSRGDQVVGVTGVSMGAHAEYVRVPHEGVVGVQTLWTSKFGDKKAVLGFTGLRSASARAADMTWLLGLVQAGKLMPVIDRRFSLAQVADAHRYVDTGRKKGAVVITMPPPVST